MVTRIRRNKPVDKTSEIENLMKLISEAEETIALKQAEIKSAMPELYELMKAQGIEQHRCEDIVAERYRPAGRATNIVDPKAFRKLVPNDTEYYAAIAVSVTKAREVLPKKQLDSITTTIPGKLGEETVKVSKWTAKK